MTPHPGGDHHRVVPHRSSNPPPPALLLLLGLAVVAALVWGIFLLGGIEYAYRRIGIPEGAMFGLIFAELAGSAINIPVKRLHGQARQSAQDIQIFGRRYRIPVVQPDTTTTLAVNLGGAVIPTGVSVFLLVKYSIWWQAAVGVTVVALIVHLIARPSKVWASRCQDSSRRSWQRAFRPPSRRTWQLPSPSCQARWGP